MAPPTVSTDSAQRALLERLIDDASLFPPAQLAMRHALRAHARHRESAYAFVAGNFVVPASRLDELAQLRDPSQPLKLSVILDAALTAKGDTVRADLERIGRSAFDGVGVSSLEWKARADLGNDELRRAIDTIARSSAGDMAVWYEPNYSAGWKTPPEQTMAAIVAARESAPATLSVGAKLRCGGLVPGATPSVDDLAAFLVAAQAHDIPWKATAGLHHPVRGEHGGETMHGFLNVFIAAVALHAGVLDPLRVAAVLAEEDARAFVVDPAHVGWRDVRVETDAVAAARAWCVSFGSCSFDEPVNGLRDLGILL